MVRAAVKPTIESLEGKVWPEPEWQSGLVLTAHALRKKPLDEHSPNDLRVAFNEDIGTQFLKARVLEVLAESPTAGDLFDGDLIRSVMRSRQFREDDSFRKKIVELAVAALKMELDANTRNEIENLVKAKA
jgi:contact-dependent growth inhibition (CDI) system CdiI-like immunity protein